MIHPYDPQAAMAAEYEAFARKNAATARRLGPSPWRDDWMPATKETLMDAPEPTNQAMAAASRAFDAGAEVYISGGTTRIEFTEDVFERWFTAEVAAARAPQAATATNGAGDDAGAAHDPHRAATSHTEARMRPEDVPDEWVALADTAARRAFLASQDTTRHILAAVIPAIRAAIADEIEAAADQCTAMDETTKILRTQGMHRAATIARGDQ